MDNLPGDSGEPSALNSGRRTLIEKNIMTTHHTPGPWKVIPCPMHAGKHPLHDQRWIATADTEIGFGHDPRSWALESGSLICEMRDGPLGNAPLIAAAPEMLSALELDLTFHSRPFCEQSLPEFRAAGYTGDPDGRSMKRYLNELKDAAIGKAKGGAK